MPWTANTRSFGAWNARLAFREARSHARWVRNGRIRYERDDRGLRGVPLRGFSPVLFVPTVVAELAASTL